jgi:predicted PurR-regulated permease PerM
MFGVNWNTARNTWTCGITLSIMYALYLIRKTLLVFVIAILFAYLLFPLCEAVQRRLRLQSRTTAVIIVFALFIIVLGAFGYVMGPRLHAETHQFASQLKNPQTRERLNSWAPLGIPVGEQIIDGQSHIMDFAPLLSQTFRAAIRDVSNLIIVPIFGFFFLKDGQRLCDGAIEMIFRGTHDRREIRESRQAISNVIKDAHGMILQYMRALFYLCVVTAVSYSLAFEALRMKYALLLALIAFPLEFIPLVGPLASALIIISVSRLNGYEHVLWIVAFLGTYRIFQDYVLSPHLMTKGVKLHPLLVMFGVFAGSELGGVGGIFLSIPLLALGRLVYYEWCRGRSKLAGLPEPCLTIIDALAGAPNTSRAPLS